MKIVFRTDASIDIGSGHVMRCLTLADELKAKDRECIFICREHDSNLIDVIRNKGYKVFSLPSDSDENNNSEKSTIPSNHYEKWFGANWQIDAEQTHDIVNSINPDWLIIDHYGVDEHWELKLRNSCKHIMVIDDLANRYHNCDLLLDQTLGRKVEEYTNLTPEHCIKLTGTEYALLRPEFSELRDYSLRRREHPELKELLVFMGGADKFNVTEKILEVLKVCPLPNNCHITVVMGLQSLWLEKVKKISLTMPWQTDVRVNVSDMASLMADSDLAIGAAGSTAWERCCLGLPTLMIILADNQRNVASALDEAHAAYILGDISEVKSHIDCIIPEEVFTIEFLDKLSRASREVTEGKGVKNILYQMGNAS